MDEFVAGYLLGVLLTAMVIFVFCFVCSRIKNKNKDKPRSTRQDGFTLLELMIVIAVIAVIVALAIPGFLRAQQSAHESSAIRYMRSWSTAQEQYRRTYGIYADSDDQLVDSKCIQVGKSDSRGYTFSIDSPSGERFIWNGTARPNTPGLSGNLWFYIDSSGVIRYSNTGPANSTSDPIGD